MNRKKQVDHLIIDDVKQGVKEVKGVVSALGVGGGVKDDRYNKRKDRVVKIFNEGGYKIQSPGPTLTQFKATAKDAPDKAKDMKMMFDRLGSFVKANLNYYNPGLGDKFTNEAGFTMINKGDIAIQSLDYLQKLVDAYPPGTYKPTFKEAATVDLSTKTNGQQQAPGLTAAQVKKKNLEMLSSVRPVMEQGLRANGSVPNSDLELLSEQFYNEIVAPASSKYETDSIDEAITNSILTFVATLVAKKQAGEPMNPVYEKIASVTQKVQEKVEQQVKTQAGNTLGNWIIENPLASALIVIVIGLILAKLFKVI